MPPEDLCTSAKNDTVDHLEIIIDGTQLMGGLHPSTLLGKGDGYLPQSRRFQLVQLERLADGRCRVKYRSSKN